MRQRRYQPVHRAGQIVEDIAAQLGYGPAIASNSGGRIQTLYSGPDVPLRFRYQTFEFGDQDIHLRSLRDTQQFSDPGGEAQLLGISAANWALFGVIWDSSQVLARLMFNFEIEGKRILELGCGIALSSLLINRRGGDITATDYHPQAGPFLQRNTQLNHDAEIPFFRADWDDSQSTHGRFDLIIGSDILYERNNMLPLARFIQGHARNKCEVLVVDPGRKQSGLFNQRMSHYGFSYQQDRPLDVSYLDKPFSGSILKYTR